MEKEDKIKLFREICADIPTCSSIKEACALHGKPENFYFRVLTDYSTDEEVSKVSARARENKSHVWFNKAEDVLQKLERGELDAQTARVLVDNYLRIAGKANQRAYGDKVDVNNNVSIRKVQIEFDDGYNQDTAEVQTSADGTLPQ